MSSRIKPTIPSVKPRAFPFGSLWKFTKNLSNLLPAIFGWRSLEGCSPWGRWGLDMTEWLHFHFSLSCIGEEMATHSSVLAWKIPGTGEPGRLPSMGSQSWTRRKRLSSSSSSSSSRMGVGGIVSEWFKHIIISVHFIPIIVTSAPPHIIRH